MRLVVCGPDGRGELKPQRLAPPKNCDVVVVAAKSVVDCVLAVLACHLSGVPFVIVDDWDSQTRAVVAPLVKGKMACVLLGNVSETFVERESALSLSETHHFALTSGSSGERKLVEVSRASVAAYVEWRVKESNLNSTARILLATNKAFDPFLGDVVTWAACECALLVSTEGIPSAFKVELLDPTHVVTTPHVAQTILTNVDVPNLEEVWLGGERTSERLFKLLSETLPESCVLKNAYGLTETTVYSTVLEMKSASDLDCVSARGAARLFLSSESEIMMRGSVIGEGYVDSEERFDKRNFATGDLGALVNVDVIMLKGRVNRDFVKINGEKTSVSLVEKKALEALDSLDDALCVSNASMDGNAVLFVFSRRFDSETPCERKDVSYVLRSNCLNMLVLCAKRTVRTTNHKKNYEFYRSFPVVVAAAAPALATIDDPTLKTLMSVVVDVLRIAQISPKDSPIVWGVDSLTALRVVTSFVAKIEGPKSEELRAAKAQARQRGELTREPFTACALQNASSFEAFAYEASKHVESNDCGAFFDFEASPFAPLMEAVRHNDVRMAREVLKAMPSKLFVQQRKWTTPLHLACGLARDVFEMTRLLLSYFPSWATTVDSRGRTPAHVAAGNPFNEKVLLTLIENETDDFVFKRRDDNQQNLLHAACARGSENTVVELLKRKDVQIDVLDRWYRTPLTWAVINDRSNVVEILLKAGASIDSKRLKLKVGKRGKSTHLEVEGPREAALRLNRVDVLNKFATACSTRPPKTED